MADGCPERAGDRCDVRSPGVGRRQRHPALVLQLKLRDSDSNTGVHDSYGFGLGANLNRYLGFEISGDRFEIFPKVRGWARSANTGCSP